MSEPSLPSVVLVHNILPPYRVDLFNAIAAEIPDFTILFARRDHPKRRSWAWTFSSLEASHQILKGAHTEVRGTSLGVSIGTRAALDRLDPDVVVAAGWDLWASWAGRRWARSHDRPFVVWSEASASSGRSRSAASDYVRRRFLSTAASALVPGEAARTYVSSLRPGLATYPFPNSVAWDDLASPEEAATADRVGSIFVGELSTRKGFDILSSAFRLDPEAFGGLVIVGDGPLARRSRCSCPRLS
jgi:glycosyltransferase involved in cell wall biosynthesis